VIEFEIVSEISEVETIATGQGVHGRARLRKRYGRGRWRKVKGIAKVRLVSGRIVWLRFIGTRRMASVSESSKSSCCSWILDK